LGQRPGWDQAHSTTAATIGPTPQRLSRSGAPGSDQEGDGPGVVGDLGVQDLDAAGQGAQAGRGGGSLDIPGGLRPEPPQDLTRRGVVRPRSRPRRVSGAVTTRAWSWRWASVAAWTAERRAASRTDSAARWPAAWG
jgi:hypothetical protein